MTMVDVVTCCLQADLRPSGAVLHSSRELGELSQ